MKEKLVKLSVFDRLKFLFKDSLIYGSAAAISKAFGLISFPLIARSLSVSDFGYYDYLISLVTFFTVLIQFGQDSSIARFYYEYDSKKKRQIFISQSLSFQFFCIILVLLFISIFHDQFIKAIFFNMQSENILLLLLINIPFQLLISFSQNLLRWSFQRFSFLFMSLGYTLFQTFLIFLLFILEKMTVTNLFISYISLNIIFASIGIFFIRKFLIIPTNFKNFSEILYVSLPYGVIGVLTTLNYDTGLKALSGEKNTIVEALKKKDINNIENNNLISINGSDNLVKFRQFY